MELQHALLTTRAMRRYTDAPVTGAEVEACIRAAVQAPSGGNIQPWQFVVVREPSTKATLAASYRHAYDRYELALLASLPPFRSAEDETSFNRGLAASRHLAEHLAEAPVLVLVAMPSIDLTLHDGDGPLDIGTLHASVFPAVQNLMLAARGMGIGTALTTVFRIRHDEVRRACGIPDRYEVVALVPMGRPVGRFGEARRRPAETITHWERWGEKRPFDAPIDAWSPPRPATPRIAPAIPEELDDDARQLLDGVKVAGRDTVGANIFATLVRHKGLFRHWLPFGGKLLSGKLPARERELLILRTGWRTRSHYEWGQHVIIARLVGITDDEIARARLGPEAEGWTDADRTLLRAADELHDDACISDATWAELAKTYDELQLVEIPMVVGHYHLVAFTLNSLGVQREPGVAGFDG
jgi:nitroreductase/alkylhydroperoxidase family enzyme